MPPAPSGGRTAPTPEGRTAPAERQDRFDRLDRLDRFGASAPSDGSGARAADVGPSLRTAAGQARAEVPPAPRTEAAPVSVHTPALLARRGRVRRRGPFVALVLPAVLGVVALVLLRGSATTASGVFGFVLAVLAAPLLPAFGAPLRTGSGAVTLAVATSALLWFVLGAVAAARATRPVGGWGRFWTEYLWLAACAWGGALLAVVAANLVLGRVLL